MSGIRWCALDVINLYRKGRTLVRTPLWKCLIHIPPAKAIVTTNSQKTEDVFHRLFIDIFTSMMRGAVVVLGYLDWVNTSFYRPVVVINIFFRYIPLVYVLGLCKIFLSEPNREKNIFSPRAFTLFCWIYFPERLQASELISTLNVSSRKEKGFERINLDILRSVHLCIPAKSPT